MAPPQQVVEWLARNYPKPKIDPEWLDACYDWIIEEQNLNPATDMPAIIARVEEQVLGSDLSDSMLAGTGLPRNIDTAIVATLSGPAVLVEIRSITDIGVSAYNLDKVRQAREERIADGEENEGEGDVDVEGEGPIPTYPRSMLSLEISDGLTTLKAMEYRSLPELKLGTTPLGYKMLLKGAVIRRGIVLLQPSCVEMRGNLSAEREANQTGWFAMGLRKRLGIPEPDPQPMEVEMEPAAAPAPRPVIPYVNARSPLREISPPPNLPFSHRHDDDYNQARRRRIPNHSHEHNPTPAPPSSATLVPSSLFSMTSTTVDSDFQTDLERSFPDLSPARSSTVLFPSDDEDDENLALGRRPIAPLPRSSLGRAHPPLEASLSMGGNGKGKEKASGDASSEFEFDDDWTDELLAGVDALEGKVESMPAPSVVSSGGSSGLCTGIRSTSEAPKGGGHTFELDTEVITIEEDSEDEKENVPVPRRHTFGGRAPGRVITKAEDLDNDVIELSD